MLSCCIIIFCSDVSDGGVGYVSVLSAHSDTTSRNKYVALAVSYTLQIESVHCLSWNGGREWINKGCTPQPGSSPFSINCRYHIVAI